MVKLKSSLPPGELNGLYDIATDAVACPSRVRLVVGLVEVPEVRKNIRKGFTEPVFEVAHIEPLPPCLIRQGYALLSQAMELRLPPSLFGEKEMQAYLDNLLAGLDRLAAQADYVDGSIDEDTGELLEEGDSDGD
ncbi:MAG: hypothetical protein KH307_09630 [Varibaculum cambriense]|uniref:hypothetical protein n=1 Tax=Varibaculum cambriense TaxID=184870 RepID=UPI00241C1288|nr:hypothetical protein [Varibaculum cambriense]MBS6620531.1 hypothetical protein [Varibaculum cambriense]